MSEKWYPVLNYEECIECGACFDKCKHGVYKKEGNRPIVVSPKGCVQGCHGCGNLCPAGAIEYVGDTAEGNSPGEKACCEGDSACSDDCNCG